MSFIAYKDVKSIKINSDESEFYSLKDDITQQIRIIYRKHCGIRVMYQFNTATGRIITKYVST